MAGKFRTRRNT